MLFWNTVHIKGIALTWWRRTIKGHKDVRHPLWDHDYITHVRTIQYMYRSGYVRPLQQSITSNIINPETPGWKDIAILAVVVLNLELCQETLNNTSAEVFEAVLPVVSEHSLQTRVLEKVLNQVLQHILYAITLCKVSMEQGRVQRTSSCSASFLPVI